MHINGSRLTKAEKREGEQAVKDFMRDNLCHIALLQMEENGEPYLQWVGNTGVKFGPRFTPEQLQEASAQPINIGLKVHE